MVVVEVNGYEIEPGADLTGANLYRMNLIGVTLTGAYLVLTDLPVANLTGAHLVLTNLEGANLEGANFSGAYLSGAKANKDTTWPEGFDPVAAGVIFKD